MSDDFVPQPPKIKVLESLLDSALEHASHGWKALEHGIVYCPTCRNSYDPKNEKPGPSGFRICSKCGGLSIPVSHLSLEQRIESDIWPPKVNALVGTAPYHLAAMIGYVKRAYDLIKAEQDTPSMYGLKPIPEPTFVTNALIAQQLEQDMKKLTVICGNCDWRGTVGQVEEEWVCPKCKQPIDTNAIQTPATDEPDTKPLELADKDGDKTAKCSQCSWAGTADEAVNGIVSSSCPTCGSPIEILE
jgi:hypothetical protein